MQINDEVLIRLSQIIEDSGLNRRKFAESIGVSPPTISEIFNNKIHSLSGTITKILELKYGINPIWLETGSGSHYRDSIILTDQEEILFVLNTRKLSLGNKKLLTILCDVFYRQQLEMTEQASADSPVKKRKIMKKQGFKDCTES
ncbi:MAG: helix-turn-helix transcriptional regulator [Leptospirales bacterium]